MSEYAEGAREQGSVLNNTGGVSLLQSTEEQRECQDADEKSIGIRHASGMQELESLLASSIPEYTPPSQNLLGSPPKRDMAANPLSHSSSWEKIAYVSSMSNLAALDNGSHVDVETESCHGATRSSAIPIGKASMCRWTSGVSSEHGQETPLCSPSS
jgi:hypothetical protein